MTEDTLLKETIPAQIDELLEKLWDGTDNTILISEISKNVVVAGRPAVQYLLELFRSAQIWATLRVFKRAKFEKIGKEDDGTLNGFSGDPWKNMESALVNILVKAGETAMAPLIEATKDSHWEVQERAIMALEVIGDIRAVEAFIDLLDHIMLKSKAEEALVRMALAKELPVIEELIKKSETKSIKIRKEVIRLLAKMRSSDYDRAAFAFRGLLIKMLSEPIQLICKEAAKALDELGWKPSDTEEALYLIAKEEWEKVGSLGVLAVRPLTKMLPDLSYSVLKKAVGVLEKLNWNPSSDTEKILYFIATGNWEAIASLGLPAIESLTKALSRYGHMEVQKGVPRAWEKIYSQITTIYFGGAPGDKNRAVWHNPDVSNLIIPIKNLNKVEVDTATYDFHQVERFITYAANYLDKKYLKKCVKVNIHGDPGKLHQNLRNLFEEMFGSVKFN